MCNGFVEIGGWHYVAVGGMVFPTNVRCPNPAPESDREQFLADWSARMNEVNKSRKTMQQQYADQVAETSRIQQEILNGKPNPFGESNVCNKDGTVRPEYTAEYFADECAGKDGGEQSEEDRPIQETGNSSNESRTQGAGCGSSSEQPPQLHLHDGSDREDSDGYRFGRNEDQERVQQHEWDDRRGLHSVEMRCDECRKLVTTEVATFSTESHDLHRVCIMCLSEALSKLARGITG